MKQSRVPENRIVLNVGGTRYETTRNTLMSLPDTLLCRMFSPENEHMVNRDDDGSVFFDRNGRLFERVLDVYRTFTLSYPSDETEKERLEQEYDYWGLVDMRKDEEIKRVIRVHNELLSLANSPTYLCSTPAVDLVLCGSVVHTFIAALQTVAEFLDSVNLKINTDGIYLNDYDYNDISIIGFSLPSQSFAKYCVTEDKGYGLCLKSLLNFVSPLVKSMTRQHALRLCVDKQDATNLIVQLFREGQDDISFCYKVIPLLTLEAGYDISFHDEFAYVVQVETTEFRDAVMNHFPNCQKFSECGTVTLRTVPSGVALLCKGMLEWDKIEMSISGRFISEKNVPNRAKFSFRACKKDEGPIVVGEDTEDLVTKKEESLTKRICLNNTRQEKEEDDAGCKDSPACILTTSPKYLKDFFRKKMPYSTTSYISLRNDYPLGVVQRIGEHGEGKLFLLLCPCDGE